MAKFVKIDSMLVLNVLSNAMGFESKEIPGVGKTIEMSARDAFSYAVLSSSGYLDPKEPDNLFQLTRDHYRVFNQAEEFEFQTGIFSLSDLRFFTTVNTEAAKKPYILDSRKYILPIEYSRHRELVTKLSTLAESIRERGLHPADFIITPIRLGNSEPSEFESFFEYMVSSYFNGEKYITDTQIPFFYGKGTPDIAAYRVPEFLSPLTKLGFIRRGGSIIEIMGASVFGFHSTKEEPVPEKHAIVFEVKTSEYSAPQIKKYTSTGIFNKAYEVIPVSKIPEKYAGLISVKADGQMQLFESAEPIQFSKVSQERYLNWLEIYLKFYILANLTSDELENLMSEAGAHMNRSGLVTFARSKDLEDMGESVKEIIERRKTE